MEDETKTKWYFRTWSLIISFLIVGPVMLPLVWSNPRFTRSNKIIISAIVIALSILLLIGAGNSIKLIHDYYGQIGKF